MVDGDFMEDKERAIKILERINETLMSVLCTREIIKVLNTNKLSQ
jgi:hypothetical protein